MYRFNIAGKVLDSIMCAFSFFKEQDDLLEPHSVCIFFSILEPVDHYSQNLLLAYVAGGHSNLMIFNFVQLVITAPVSREQHFLKVSA
jgi:hypothetical protein